jgi:hypothetical protein
LHSADPHHTFIEFEAAEMLSAKQSDDLWSLQCIAVKMLHPVFCFSCDGVPLKLKIKPKGKKFISTNL